MRSQAPGIIRYFTVPPELMGRTIRHGSLLLFVGFGLIGLVCIGLPFGTFSGLMGIMCGACCASFFGYHRTYRIWILAAVPMALVVPIYLFLSWLGLIVEHDTTWWALDLFLGTAMLGFTVRLLLSLLIYNWRLWRGMKAARGQELADQQ